MANFTLRPMTVSERKYSYVQSPQIQGQTGNIGYLRGDFGSNGNWFYTTWFDTRSQWKSDEFKQDLDDVINALRSQNYGLLRDRATMYSVCRENKDSEMKGNYTTEFGFRADSDKYAFLLRCIPVQGDYNFYCFCYVRKWLDKHIEEANRDIRFIDSHYKELFRIPDGEHIIVTDRYGKMKSYPCRYIDDYHLEVGRNLFHICEFAERMEQDCCTYRPESAAGSKNYDERWMYMKKEDFYNTNKDMNNLTTMLIDLLLKRLLEERYSEFYTESLSESKRYYHNPLLVTKYLRFESVIKRGTALLIFIDLLLEVFALLTGVLSPTFALISCCVLIILLYLCLIATIDYDKKNRKIESFIISKNSDGSFVIAVLYRHREQFAIYRIESITNLKIENKTIIIKLKGYFLYSDDEKFNDNGIISLPAVYDDEFINDINKLKGWL